MRNTYCQIHDDYKQCAEMLKIEVKRKDNKILEISTERLEELTRCSIHLVKKLIIRLRRAMPTGVISHSYGLKQHAESDWKLFNKIVKRDIDNICLNLSDRWIMAILDTYIDYGTNNERKNAMLGVLFIRMERIFMTEQFAMRNIEPSSRKSSVDAINIKENTRCRGWSDIMSTQMPVDDFYPNFFYRLFKTMEDTPEVYKMNKKIITNAINSENSSIGLICSFSKWIKNSITEQIR